jgi:predicted ATPase
MTPDRSEEELLRLAQDLDEGRPVDWDRHSTDPAMLAGIEGLRDIEKVTAALGREPEPLDTSGQARAWLDPGSVLGRYPIEREAGRGGMGVVYLARDQVLDRPVALKLLPLDVARSPARLERFTREAKLLASLNHANVATIYGLEEDARGLRFLALEWVAGETLAARLGRGPLPWREALEVCGQIARGLAAAHEGGVIHRDLKPGNVMITPRGQVKVLDFGLARRGVAPGDLPAGPSEPTVKGTWGYVSPECLTREEDHRADVFAFGCVLYECLAGAPAFPGETVDEIREALLRREPDMGRLPGDVPPMIRRLIASSLTKDPDRRLGSMGEALRSIEAALGRRAAPPTPSEAARAVPHRLPEESDAFVGRERELGDLAATLRRGARLVTLQGPGGMGKTRLAIRHAWHSLEEWPGGAWFCDLTEAQSPDGIVAAVARGLGLQLGQANPVAQIGYVIAGRGRCLLILDNFDQVVGHAPATVAPWLAASTDARLLVTSRESLGLPEEVVKVIDPLDSEPGIELFVERARTHRTGFMPEGVEADSVREIVRLVEGLPLAIELAAARIRMMSPAQIVERMRERFRLLAGSGGGRHATMRAAIDGSWELLDPWEQAAFAQCAVFEGGFTLAAAEAVLDLKRWNEAPWIPDVVQSLVDRSLLRTWLPERDGDATEPEARFGMFASLQEYAREKLAREDMSPEAGNGALRAAEERHGSWYARRGSEEEIAALNQRGGRERWRALGRDLDNLVAACRRAAARGDGATAAATCAAAWEVFQLRGPFSAGMELGREVLAAGLEDRDRRRVLTVLGLAEWRSGQVSEGLAHLEAALSLHQKEGDRRAEGAVLGFLGALQNELFQLEDSRARLEAALAIHREVGDRRREGIEMARLAILDQQQGLEEEARARMEAALVIAREVGDRIFEAQLLGHLGGLHRDRGSLEESRAHYELALAIAREVGNRRHEGIMLLCLGIQDQEQGRSEDSLAHGEAALVILREVGDRSFEANALTTLGSLQLDQGRFEDARSKIAAALTIKREVGDRLMEGFLLGEMGRLQLAQGRIEEARPLLIQGEVVLRDIGDRLDLAKLLCLRVELERRAGNVAAARGTLVEVEALAVEIKMGAGSDLERQLTKVRQALAAQP